MSEAAVAEAPTPEKVLEKPKRVLKPKIQAASPVDIVDVWRLVEHSLRQQPYPDCTEDNPDQIRSHLFAYLQQPTFSGLIARLGRRPVGTILGHAQVRPFGRPARFAMIFSFWVDPKFRGQGIGRTLWNEYATRLKKEGIFHFETWVDPCLSPDLAMRFSSRTVLEILGGRL